MATFAGLPTLQPLSGLPGTYMKLSPDQLASATRYGIQRTYTCTMGCTRKASEGPISMLFLQVRCRRSGLKR
jgi:hypothetical protein